jgi:hypothetical protein
MDDRDARLRSHEQNISHYQNILKTRLSEVELHFVEKRLSEERFKKEPAAHSPEDDHQSSWRAGVG